MKGGALGFTQAELAEMTPAVFVGHLIAFIKDSLGPEATEDDVQRMVRQCVDLAGAELRSESRPPWVDPA